MIKPSGSAQRSERRYQTFRTTLGPVLVAADGDQVVRVAFQASSAPEPLEGRPSPKDGLLCQAREQIEQYLAGERHRFDLPLLLKGTDFQRRVWRALQQISYGELVGYGDVAKRVRSHGAARAVGAASGKNPLPIVVPCHRVIGANGSLVGYTGGLRFKRALIELERRALQGSQATAG